MLDIYSFIKAKLIYFILIAISIFGLSFTGRFPKTGSIGIGFFPRLIFVFLILLSVVLILRKEEKSEDTDGDGLHRVRSIAIVTLTVIAGVMVMQYLHFAAGAFAFLLLYLKLIGKRAWMSSIVISAIGAVCLLIPVYLLHVPM